MSPRPLWLSTLLTVVTIALGLGVRFAHFGQPQAVAKYGGSALWALVIYWLVSTLGPHLRIRYAALLSKVIATTVEFFKLVHSPAIDSFRGTLAGILLLGRFFSFQDIAAYILAILLGAWADGAIRALIRHEPAAFR